MRHKKYIKGGYGYRTIDHSGGNPNSRIRLYRHPVEEMEGATKGYVNQKLDNLDGGAFTEGEVAVEVMPEYVGDISKPAGSKEVELMPTGVVPGLYPKVTVGKDGRVISGGNLKASDLPNIPFERFDEIPQDYKDLGIEDDLLLEEGGDFTGRLYLDYDVSSSSFLSLVRKQDVDVIKDIALDKVPVGGIVASFQEDTPKDFLRVNGGMVDTSLYPELAALINGKYGSGSIVGSGKPWKNQNSFNEATGLGAWVQDADLPIINHRHMCVVTKNRLYMIGGRNNSGIQSNTVYYAPILEDGSLGTWVQDTNLPIGNDSHQCVVIKDRLYMIGGVSGSLLNTVYYAPILEDGSLGTWVQDANLPIGMGTHQCVVTKNRLYMIGGVSGPGIQSNTVYYAPILEDGSLGTWVQDTNLPINNGYLQCVVTKNRLYMIGGFNGSGYLNTVYYAPILEDGSLGTWVQDTNLPISTRYHQCVVTKNRLYMIGGHDGSGHLNTVYYAPILEDGSLGTWTRDTDLPITNVLHLCVVTKNRLYMIGGRNSPNIFLNTVYYAPLVIPTGKQGGKNDYSEYYGDPVSTETTPPGKFRLPTPTHVSNDELLNRDIHFYIRYQ